MAFASEERSHASSFPSSRADRSCASVGVQSLRALPHLRTPGREFPLRLLRDERRPSSRPSPDNIVCICGPTRNDRARYDRVVHSGFSLHPILLEAQAMAFLMQVPGKDFALAGEVSGRPSGNAPISTVLIDFLPGGPTIPGPGHGIWRLARRVSTGCHTWRTSLYLYRSSVQLQQANGQWGHSCWHKAISACTNVRTVISSVRRNVIVFIRWNPFSSFVRSCV